MAHAESIVARGDADMVGMARAQVAIEIVSKAFELRSDDIRVHRLQSGMHWPPSQRRADLVHSNPVTGRELTLGKLTRANSPSACWSQEAARPA